MYLKKIKVACSEMILWWNWEDIHYIPVKCTWDSIERWSSEKKKLDSDRQGERDDEILLNSP